MSLQKNITFIVAGAVVVLIYLLFFVDYPQTTSISLSNNSSLGPVIRAGGVLVAYVSSPVPENISFLSYSTKPAREIVVFEGNGIGNNHFDDFFNYLKSFEQKGFSVRKTRAITLGKGEILVIPTGAMPDSLIDNPSLWVDRYVYYFGRHDLSIRQGDIKNEEWYSSLSSTQKEHLIDAGTSIEDIWQNHSFIRQDIEFQPWIVNGSRSYLSNGVSTLYFPSHSTYARLVSPSQVQDYVLEAQPLDMGIIELEQSKQKLVLITINRTQGNAVLTVSKNGVNISSKQIGRVVEETVFEEPFKFDVPGTYVAVITDMSGPVGGGVLHIPELTIIQTQKFGRRIHYWVTQDGVPYDGEIQVSLNNGTSKQLYVNQGELTVEAKFHEGTNELMFKASGNTISKQVDQSGDSFLAPFITLGIPGGILVLCIYGFIRFSKKPTYLLRVPEQVREVRKNVSLTASQFEGIFRQTQKDLSISGPLSLAEIMIGLRKYLTLGADMTEGNIEHILLSLEKEGKLKGFRGYYLIGDAKDLERKTLIRIVHDRLIGRGIECVITKDSIKTKHAKVIFSLDSLSQTSSVLVFEDLVSMESHISSLSPENAALLRMRVKNGQVKITTLDKFEDVL